MNAATVIAKCIETVNTLHEGTKTIYRSAGFDPNPDSKAEKELSITKGKELLLTAFNQGSMLLEIVADQAMAFTKTITSPAQTIAPWTTARSTLEPSALGCWLMDISIDEKTRVGRSYALRYAGLKEEEKYLRVEKQDKVAEEVTKRINDVERQALALGYPPIQDRNGRRIGIGQRMPTATELIDQVLDMGATYRLLSAAVHAHFWAIGKLCFEEVPEQKIPSGADVQSGIRVHFRQKALNTDYILSLTTEVIRAFAQIVWTKFVLYGWDLTELRKVLENTYDILHFKDSERFWRR